MEERQNIIANDIQHFSESLTAARTKHIELDIHFVREKVAVGDVRVLHVPTGQQFVDIMTKGLPSSVFQEFRSSFGISPTDATTAGGCWRREHVVPGDPLHDPLSVDHGG